MIRFGVTVPKRSLDQLTNSKGTPKRAENDTPNVWSSLRDEVRQHLVDPESARDDDFDEIRVGFGEGLVSADSGTMDPEHSDI